MINNLIRNLMRVIMCACIALFFTACGFHLQRQVTLAPPLHRMYVQAADPYGQLARQLKQHLKTSNVMLVSAPGDADTILNILQDNTTQDLLSVSGSLQTRQYVLRAFVVFAINDRYGRMLLGPQTLVESRVMTVQSNQVLGSSNEENLFYQQMRRSLVYSIMNRLASRQVTNILMRGYARTPINSALLNEFRPQESHEPVATPKQVDGKQYAPGTPTATPPMSIPTAPEKQITLP